MVSFYWKTYISYKTSQYSMAWVLSDNAAALAILAFQLFFFKHQ